VKLLALLAMYDNSALQGSRLQKYMRLIRSSLHSARPALMKHAYTKA